ncbi:MAG: hypothetical protein QM817_02180 [Archangium sp.]
MNLSGPLPAWDVARRSTHVSELVARLLEALREKGAAVSTLDRLHTVADAARALELSQHLSFSLSRGEGKRLVHELLRATLPHLPWAELAVQTVPHVRVLIPGDAIAPVPPHTDHDIGHQLYERNLWFALTDALDTRALRLATFAQSMSLLDARKGPLFPRALELPRVEAREGDVLLFTPLHAHAAEVVRGDATRVSMDLRIAPLAAVRRRELRTFVPHLEVPHA